MIAKGGRSVLLDNAGLEVQAWPKSGNNFNPGYLLEDGTLLSFEGSGFSVLDWDGNVLWGYSASQMHHDVEPLPNGNVLVVSVDALTRAEALAAGRDPALLGNSLNSMALYEIESPGNVVWEWHAWDHLVQADR
jgi:hypothetical protein